VDPKRASDHQIACRLMQQRYIRADQYDVWLRSRAEESVWSMRHDYPNETRGCTFSAPTLKRWVEEVDAEIAKARLITAPEVEEVRDRQTIPCADGSNVVEKGDPTPAGRIVTEESSWDPERLMLTGTVDRYSRKRG